LAVWAASLGDGEARAFHAQIAGQDEAGATLLEGIPEPEGEGGLIMLSDPYTFPTDAVLAGLADQAPGVPVLGGLSSARTMEGGGALFLDQAVLEHGAVGVELAGVEMLPCVSQGAVPLGREMTITAAEGNIIHELAGRPAIETIEQVIGEMEIRERALVAAGLLLGIVIDGGKPEYEQGDFLVRGVMGADPETGAVAVGATVAPGQVVRLHARDARSADEDLRRELRLRSAAIGNRAPAGALVFSCNGRGQSMFGASDHDATMLADELGGAPAAGFFAAGEIGPVGGRSFLHGFTATVAVFPA
jgi:small ligand-binding sensory domain FIST